MPSKAGEDRQRAIADAQAYANDICRRRRAAAQRQLTDAQVYATQTVANAEGEAERFTQLADSLRAGARGRRAAGCTSRPWRTILSRSHKIVIDAKNGSGNMIYLPLDKLAEAMRAGAAPQRTAAQPAPAAALARRQPGAPPPRRSAARAAAATSAPIGRARPRAGGALMGARC